MYYVLSLMLLLATVLKGEEQKAQDFQGVSNWINSDPIHIEDLQGKVVLIDFWDYTCINCIRTLPHLTGWYKDYKDKGFTIVGVHTPEFSFEQSLENVQAAVKRFHIQYPVALDNDYKTWRAYHNKYWPTSYLVNKEGNIVFTHIGEGNYQELENAIRKELGLAPLANKITIKPHPSITPETYLGSARAESYTSEIALSPNSVESYTFKAPLKDDQVGLKGLWRVASDSITSAGSNCQISIKFTAGTVHAVIGGKSSEPLTLYLDGKALPQKYSTNDTDLEGQIFLDGDRKYDLVDLHGDVSTHVLSIDVPAGIAFYTFTFGIGEAK